VVVTVMGKMRVQPVARFARFPVANVVGKNNVVTADVERLAGAEQRAGEVRVQKLMAGATGAVQVEWGGAISGAALRSRRIRLGHVRLCTLPRRLRLRPRATCFSPLPQSRYPAGARRSEFRTPGPAILPHVAGTTRALPPGAISGASFVLAASGSVRRSAFRRQQRLKAGASHPREVAECDKGSASRKACCGSWAVWPPGWAWAGLPLPAGETGCAIRSAKSSATGAAPVAGGWRSRAATLAIAFTAGWPNYAPCGQAASTTWMPTPSWTRSIVRSAASSRKPLATSTSTP